MKKRSHPAGCSWLTNRAKERVYCANGYFRSPRRLERYG